MKLGSICIIIFWLLCEEAAMTVWWVLIIFMMSIEIFRVSMSPGSRKLIDLNHLCLWGTPFVSRLQYPCITWSDLTFLKHVDGHVAQKFSKSLDIPLLLPFVLLFPSQNWTKERSNWAAIRPKFKEQQAENCRNMPKYINKKPANMSTLNSHWFLHQQYNSSRKSLEDFILSSGYPIITVFYHLQLSHILCQH